MDENLVHIIFCIDESGSMYNSVNDVVSGFEKTINEQKDVKDGRCIVSLFTFNDKVKECFIGKELNDVEKLDYHPGGMTALYDGICTTIDKIGDWYNKQPEDKRGGKKIVVIITDGEENSSTEFRLSDVRKKVKTQESEFDWSFIYLGNDLSNAKDACDMGIQYRGFTSKKKFYNNYDIISTGVTAYRTSLDSVSAAIAFDDSIKMSLNAVNEEYKKDTGIDLTSNKGLDLNDENSWAT